jgi:hypothetical protein
VDHAPGGYPDYTALRRALRRRSIHALRGRVRALGIAKKRYRWTAAAVSRLRRIYPTGTRAEILAAFPGTKWQQIKDKRKEIKLYRARKPPAKTGYPIIDVVRARAFELNISMPELDAMARTKWYFQQKCWRRYGVNGRAVYRAIEALRARSDCGRMTAKGK